ncbi:efflux RND transporter periplasmic adaptor subunit [Synechococcus sp. CBW1004]|nr:efflux RND transporter periplasmic adaptor subunit [Synechococcus sp. CBW1004]
MQLTGRAPAPRQEHSERLLDFSHSNVALMNKHLRPIFPLLVVALGAVALLRFFTAASKTTPTPVAGTTPRPQASIQPARSGNFSALGYLEPVSKVRVLAAPIQVTEGAPRIQSLNVDEGQQVEKGQILAVFDTLQRVDSQKELVIARIASIKSQARLLENETKRYRQLAKQGVFPAAELEIKELKLLELKSQLREAIAELNKSETERQYSFLRAPISGTILKVLVRTGERPSPRGVMELGATDQMMAVIQVNEDNIRQIHLGQDVILRSENMSFPQRLNGTVSRISQKIGNRKQLSQDPRDDSDWEARTIDVEVRIQPDQSAIVSKLTGAKVVAIFQK